MNDKIYSGDIFIRKNVCSDCVFYTVLYVTWVNRNNQYFGDVHSITDRGVETRFNEDITRGVTAGIPVSEAFYRKIVKLIDKAQIEAMGILLRAKHETTKQLKEGSCFAYINMSGVLSVNKVEFFGIINCDGTIILSDVEKGSEVFSESFNVATRSFYKRDITWLFRDDIDEDEDFIISRIAYNKIAQLHLKLVSDLRTLLDANVSL